MKTLIFAVFVASLIRFGWRCYFANVPLPDHPAAPGGMSWLLGTLVDLTFACWSGFYIYGWAA